MKMNKMEHNIQRAERMSNIELLRIVAMFFIIVHHLVGKSASTCGYVHPYNPVIDGYIGLIFNGLVVGGKCISFDYRMVWLSSH
jgi:peptidoglycan/LPS O-acetylase OafA/YrhL